uniref:Uncharacterized protein n=1 Tax=Anopheles farauti TaxID=69004 RepID=A0A182QVW0_9DIPT
MALIAQWYCLITTGVTDIAISIMIMPVMNMPVPAESSVVIVLGAFGYECLGELMIMTGSDTTNTHTACRSKKEKHNINDRTPNGTHKTLKMAQKSDGVTNDETAHTAFLRRSPSSVRIGSHGIRSV